MRLSTEATSAILGLEARGLLGIGTFIVALFAAVMFHEFGHYYMARRSGMKVTEFFFGFGPRIWSTKRRTIVRDNVSGETREVETEFGIKAIPLGGYVKITGMSAYEDIEESDRGFTYAGKPFRQRALVVVAGPIANALLAFVLLVVLAMAGALPDQERPVPRIAELAPYPGCESVARSNGQTESSGRPEDAAPQRPDCAMPTPAEQAGLVPGDEFVAADGLAVASWSDVREVISSNVGRTVVFTVRRDGRLVDIPVTIGERPPLEGEEGPRPFIGVVVGTETVRDDPAAATVRAGKYMAYMTAGAFQAIKNFFSPSYLKRYLGLLGGSQDEEANNNRFVSVVGLGQISAQAAEAGWKHLLFVIVIFNVFLGLFNILPLYPLDGGHFAVALYEKVAGMVRRREVRVDIRKLAPIAAAVVAIFVFLAVTSIYLDVTNPISNPFR
jgi:membrane-associated protease RseP (regulator of RpoE activity)